MGRFFNTAGPCVAERHYMLPAERRLPDVREFAERQHYFVVHAPRQTGKTTAFRYLAEALDSEGPYAAIYASCETGQTAGSEVDRGVQAILQDVATRARRLPESCRPPDPADLASIGAESRLEIFLRTWAERCPKSIVLFFDEIDALRDDTLVSVLRQLRSGYLDRPDHFPRSIALVGLRDVPSDLDPPFNITVESSTMRDFTADEVAKLYAQHSAETGQVFEAEAVAKVYEATRGQPGLVNALAREATEVQVPERAQPIGPEAVNVAVQALIGRPGAHLEALVESLCEPRVQRVIEPVVAGELIPPDLEDDLRYALDLGLVIPGAEGLEIANPIYQRMISGQRIVASR